MVPTIRRFNESTLIRVNDDADAWIIKSARYQGLFGPQEAGVWQFMENGVLRIGDVHARKFTTSIKFNFSDPAGVRVFEGDRHLWLVPSRSGDGNAIAFNLNDAEIAARVAGLQCVSGDVTRVAQNGSLIMCSGARIDEVVYSRMLQINGGGQQTSDRLIKTVLPPGSHHRLNFFTSSPGGKWWLKLDHTHFPMVEHQDFLNGPVRKYYGLTIQIWSAFPAKFERRIVVAWLKAEDLPDETQILSADALIDFKKQQHAMKNVPSVPRTGLVPGMFGRRGIAGGTVDPDQKYRAILATSVPGRDRIYTAISQALHRPGTDPEADFPSREAFGEAAHDNNLWQAITKNFADLFGDTLRNIVGWEGEDVVWFDRLGHLICVGMDGAVSPQLSFERAGLRHMMRPFAELPGKLEVRDGRRLLAVQVPEAAMTPHQERAGGTLWVDGTPAETRFEPVRISKYTDGWQGPESIPDRFLSEQADKDLVEEYRKTRSTVRIPLSGTDPQSRIEAIHTYRNLLDPTFFDRANDSSIDVRFGTGRKSMSESTFFLGIGPQDRDWAVAPLRDLVATYADLIGLRGTTTWQKDQDHGSLLAQAARRLGELDEESLAILVAYGEGIDAGHEYYFAGDTMPAIVAAHGWTDKVTAFVAWVLAFNFYNTYERPSIIWRHVGLGAALAQRPAKEAADFVDTHLAPLVEVGRLNWDSFVILSNELTPLNEWEQAFFDRLRTLIGDSVFDRQ